MRWLGPDSVAVNELIDRNACRILMHVYRHNRQLHADYPLPLLEHVPVHGWIEADGNGIEREGKEGGEKR